MSTLSTCGRCGGTLELRGAAMNGELRWRHVTEPTLGHEARPDDSAVSGPGRDDLPRCTGCHHPEHGEDGCEEEVSTGLYGTDGVLLLDWCSCTGPAAQETHLAFRSTVRGEEGLVCTCGSAHAPDPWTDPDAAARAVPPPF